MRKGERKGDKDKGRKIRRDEDGGWEEQREQGERKGVGERRKREGDREEGNGKRGWEGRGEGENFGYLKLVV